MQIDLVLTVIANDRPGLVGEIADTIADNGGNWIDSAMSRLGGEFAGIIHIVVADMEADRLERALEALGPSGISVSIRRSGPVSSPEGTRAHVEVTGQDRAGIVREVANALAHQGVSVEDLRTRLFSGSMSGQSLFTATAEVIVPGNSTLETVREALETIAQDIMVDIELTEVEARR